MVLEVTGVLQNYDWGKRGKLSEAATLFESGNKGFVVEPSAPYAELWLGTHPKGPSTIKGSGELLSSWLEKHPEINNRSSQLLFLLKVLSVETALSIQIHPNKTEAVRLHAESPKHYPDDNHKPEMAIALTPFEVLCGFRLWKEIQNFISNIEELRELTGLSSMKEIESSSLKICFTALMMNKEKLAKAKCHSWADKLKNGDPNLSRVETNQLFLRLNSQYPGDIGCFCVYFLNYITLKPGQSIFLESGLPHAYIKGDCIECMASSDNVIRAGLTSKFRDVEALCSLVKYAPRTPSDILFTPLKLPADSYQTVYKPPTPEFCVDKIELPAGLGSYTLGKLDSPSLLLVVRGGFKVSQDPNLMVAKGSVLFIGPNEQLDIKGSDSGSSTLMFRAYSQD